MPNDRTAQEASLGAQLAREIRASRRRAGLSQRQLAARIGYTSQYVSLAERIGGNLPSAVLVATLDSALDADGRLVALHARARAGQKDLRQKPANGMAKQARRTQHPATASAAERNRAHDATAVAIDGQIPALRRVLDTHDLPEDGPVRPIAELRPVVAAVVVKRLRSDYRELSVEVPLLLPELHRAFLACAPPEKPEFARMLVQVYRAADAVADKYGYYDLSARIIDLLVRRAADTGDELVEGTGSYVRGETFFASEDLDAGRRMLERAADRIRITDSETAAATYGTLHMRAAVMAGRAGNSLRARDHIDEAQRAAQLVDEGIHLGTAFGTASVRIHRVSLAVELGDVGSALRLTAGWRPPISLPAERRSHLYVELGRAHHLAGQRDKTVAAMHTALRIAPEHVRANPQVGEIVDHLRMDTAGTPSVAMQVLDRAVFSPTARERIS